MTLKTPKCIRDRAVSLKLKRNHYALIILLDSITPFVEFTTKSSNDFLDCLIQWKKTELPSLIKSDVKFFIVNIDSKNQMKIKEEKFPIYKKQIKNL